MKTPHVRYLVLLLTTACNLRCRYCYRPAAAPEAMPREVALAALSLAAGSGLPFHVQLAGGEPALETGLVELVGQTAREARWRCTLALQTNATLVSADLIDLCLRYDIGVGVSLDGPPDVQERLRGQAGATFRGLALLEEAGVPVRVTAVLSSANARRLRDLAFSLARFSNIRGIGLDPLVVAGSARDAAHLLPRPGEIVTGVRDLFLTLEWMERTHGTCIEWREAKEIRRALSGNGPSRPYCHACNGESLAVLPDGTVYPCGQTAGDPEMAAGKVDSPDWEKLKTCYRGLVLHGDCTTCPLAGRCPGDCPSRLRFNGGTGPSAMCTVYRTIAECLLAARPRETTGKTRKEARV